MERGPARCGTAHPPGHHARDGARRARRKARPHSHGSRAGVRARGAAAGPRRPGRRAAPAGDVARPRRVRRPSGAPRAHVPPELRAVPGPRPRRRPGRRPRALTRFEVVRDPLWNNIRLDPEALAVVDTAAVQRLRDRKSTRLNSSHTVISYAVFCLKKKRITQKTSQSITN